MKNTQPTPPQVSGKYWRTYWYDAAKRRHSKSLGPVATVTPRAAQGRWETWRRADFHLGLDGVRPRTVADAVEQWLKNCRKYYRRPDRTLTGEAAACQSALKYLVKLYGNMEPGDLRPAHLEAYQGQLIEAGVARSTINGYSNRCRRWCKWLVRRDLAPPAVAAGWATVPNLRIGRTEARETTARVPVLTPDLEATVRCLANPYRDLVRVLWLSGARPAELCSMKAEDIDRTDTPWVYRPTRHKTERTAERVIQFGPGARQILAESPDGFLEGGLVFGLADNTLISTRMLREAVAAACLSAGIEVWTPYQLRHAALERVEEDYGRTGSMAVAGHAAAGSTDHYVRMQTINQRRAAAIVEKIG
jgi:integrase